MGLTKAKITNLENNEVVTCLFNPTEYKTDKQNQFDTKGGVGYNVPLVTFKEGQAQTLTMELFLDRSEQPGGDVSSDVQKLYKLTLIDDSLKNEETGKARPPRCLFSWGPRWTFTSFVQQLSVSFTLFREDGTPVRATANITLIEAKDDSVQKKQNPTSFTEGGRKRRVVRPQDTLALIAYEEYGDSTKWRAIALDNRLDDPLSLRPGQVISIPSLI